MKAGSALFLFVAGCGSQNPAYEPRANAEFRFHARDLLSRIVPLCSQSDALRAQYRPVEDRYRALKRKIERSRLAMDLRIAEADEDYRRSVTLVECADPDRPSAAQDVAHDVKLTSESLGRMEAIARKLGVE